MEMFSAQLRASVWFIASEPSARRRLALPSFVKSFNELAAAGGKSCGYLGVPL